MTVKELEIILGNNRSAKDSPLRRDSASSCCAGKRNDTRTPLRRAERATTRRTCGCVAEVSKIGRSEAQERPPDRSNYTVRNPLLEA